MKPNGSDDVPLLLTISPVVGPLDSPRPAVEVQVEFGARTRGGVDRVDTDHFLVLRLGRHQETLMTSLPEDQIPPRFDEFGYGMVVADGTGHSGEVASRVAIATLVHLIVYFGKWNVRINEAIAEEMMDRGGRFYRSIDATLAQAGQPNPIGLQTTMTAVVTAGNELFFAHVGNSRAYVFRGGELLRLTRDNALATGTLGRAPVVVDAAAVGPEPGHALTGALGPTIDIERVGILDDDIVLLCTDGLTDVVDDAEIARTLAQHSRPDDQCGALVELAIAAGGTDDITALVGHYRIVG